VRLEVDDDELAACVSCGLCLPHCPTYRVTGEESASPRGRIAAMRAVHAGAEAGPAFTSFMDLCVQCRGCEAACPSGVPFGRLMEGARRTLVAERRYQPWWRRAGYRLLGHHRLLLAASSAAALAQRAGLVPARLGLPRLPVRRPRLDASGTDAWLFTGCVMDAWMRPTHAAALRAMEATGAGVTPVGAGCCGALAEHAGLAEVAGGQAARVVASMTGTAPVVVDSAGCGAVMKDYGRLLGTPGAQAFAGRVMDVSEWLATRPLPTGRRLPLRVAVQDPCHLRHVQRAHAHVRTVLTPYVEEVVELDDDGLCCGAGGAYATVHPDMAARIRALKLEAIAGARPDVVASSNPGCAMHLAAAGVVVRHPVEIIAEALGGPEALGG